MNLDSGQELYESFERLKAMDGSHIDIDDDSKKLCRVYHWTLLCPVCLSTYGANTLIEEQAGESRPCPYDHDTMFQNMGKNHFTESERNTVLEQFKQVVESKTT